jgi:AcrR family transcriptional regulator
MDEMTEPRSTDTRQALVEEAIAALRELTPAALLSAVGVKEIARRAGVGVTTVYHHFGNLEGFAEAVVGRVFDPGEMPIEQITAHVAQITADPFPNRVSIAMHAAEYDRLTADPEFRVRLGLWALGGGTTDAIYGQFLRTVDGVIGAYAAQMFAAWGRELRPPFDLPAFVAAHTALLNGTTVRALVDPGTLDRDRFARLQSALFLLTARLEGDRRTLDDRLAEINLLPVQRAKGVGLGDDRQRTRQRILDAAALVLSERPEERSTVAEIARAADLSSSTIYAQFDGVEDIAVHLLRAQAHQLPASAPAPGEAEPPVVRELGVIAAFLAGRPHLVADYAARLISGRLPHPDALVERVATVVAEMRACGSVRDGIDPHEAAESLVTLLVGRFAAAPGADPGQHADYVAALVLPGLSAPPATSS